VLDQSLFQLHARCSTPAPTAHAVTKWFSFCSSSVHFSMNGCRDEDKTTASCWLWLSPLLKRKINSTLLFRSCVLRTC
jgi:hypothetical protein